MPPRYIGLLVSVRVFDYLHNTGNKDNYLKDNDAFRKIVRAALRDEMYTERDYNVTTANNVVLRMKNLKRNASEMYLLYLNSSTDIGMPVVMAGGLWSDITAWGDLGSELASDGRDVWLIEITGGPGQDCDGCINYNYSDLTDDFWPALIGGVEGYTNKGKIQYVAHSNGCRTALDSLSNWSNSGKGNTGAIIKNGVGTAVSLSPNPVDTFVGVACPGAFRELSYFAKQLNDSGEIAIRRLEEDRKSHIKIGELSHKMESSLGEVIGISGFFENPKISLNLFQSYNNWIISEYDNQPGANINPSYFTLIYGTKGFFSRDSDDSIVPIEDEIEIFNNVNAENKAITSVNRRHTNMVEDKTVQKEVKRSLNKEIYSTS